MRYLWLPMCLLSAAASAQAPAAEERVAVTDVQGTAQAAGWDQLTREGMRVGTVVRPWADVIRCDSLRLPLPSAPAPLIVLTNGDVIRARPIETTDEVLRAAWFDFPDRPPFEAPLEIVSGCLLQPLRDPGERNQFLQRIRGRDGNQDLLFLRNGDRLAGELQELAEAGFLFSSAVGETRVKADGVRALRLNPELTVAPPRPTPAWLVTLTDGSRLTARALEPAPQGLIRLTTAWGRVEEFPIGQLQSVQVLGGRAVYLSDLKPSEYRYTPFLSGAAAWQADAAVRGGPLTLRGRTFSKGLGVRSRSELRYTLEGKHRGFQATVGIDDAAGRGGSVIFRVLADGKELHATEVLRGGDPALVLPRLDLGGSRELTLIVDFADGGDVLDDADWCDALLLP